MLIIGSGNVVHNLQFVLFKQRYDPFDWTIEFDNWVKDRIDALIFKGLLIMKSMEALQSLLCLQLIIMCR